MVKSPDGKSKFADLQKPQEHSEGPSLEKESYDALRKIVAVGLRLMKRIQNGEKVDTFTDSERDFIARMAKNAFFLETQQAILDLSGEVKARVPSTLPEA